MTCQTFKKILLWLCTVLCIISLLPAAFLIVLNQIDRVAPKSDLMILGIWAGACILGPILAWTFFRRGFRFVPWLLVGIPLSYSLFRILSDFVL